MTIGHPRSLATVRTVYDEVRAIAHGAPELDVLIDQHIVRVVWGVAHWSLKLSRIVKDADQKPVAECLRTCLRRIVDLPQGPFAALGPAAQARLEEGKGDSAAQRVIHARDGEKRHDVLRVWAAGVLAPGWVAARLWERSTGRPERVRWWLDRVDFLPHEAEVLDEHWSSEQLSELCTAVLEVFRDELDLRGWDEERRRYQRHIWNERGVLDDAERHWPDPPPADEHERLAWLELCERGGHNATHTFREELFSLTGFVIRAVLRDVSHTAPHPAIAALVELAKDRPVLWTAMSWMLHRSPELLVDLLLCPESAAWALFTLSTLSLRGSAHEQETVTADSAERVFKAFRDGAEFAMQTLLGEPRHGGRATAWLLASFFQHAERAGSRAQRKPTSPTFREELWRRLLARAADRASAVRSLVMALLDHARDQLAHEAQPFESPWLRVILDVLVHGSGLLDSEAVAAAAAAALDAYASAFTLDELVREPEPLPPNLAAALVRAVLDLEEVAHGRLLRPTEFASRALALDRMPSGERWKPSSTLKQLLRTHLRFLCRSIIGWSADERPRAIVDALRDTLDLAVGDDFARGRACAFEISLNYTGSLLAEDLGHALRTLTASQQREFVDVLAGLTEPAALAALAQGLEGEHRNELLAAAAQRVNDAPQVHSLSAVQARIEMLLDAGLLPEAEGMLAEEARIKTLGSVRGRELWRFRIGLQLALQQGRYDWLMATKPPEVLKYGEQEEAIRALDFYQALAEFRREGGALARAEATFSALHDQHREVSAYAVNLHAVRVRRAVPDALQAVERAEQRREVERILAEGDELMAEFRDALREEGDDTYEGNRLLLRFAIGQLDEALRDLEMLGGLVDRSKRLWGYRVIALAKSRRIREARAYLEEGERRFGAEPRPGDPLGQARELLEKNAEIELFVQVENRPSRVARIRLALNELRSIDPHEQAAAVRDESLHRFLVRQMREACALVQRMAPFVYDPAQSPPKEDVITELLRTLLAPMLQGLGWSLHGQDPGGYSGGRRGFGERDLIIKKDGAELAIFESLRIFGTNKKDRDALREHFQKLFGYGECDLKFLVVWSFAPDPQAVLQQVQHMAIADAPPAFPYQRGRAIRQPSGDAAPPGLISIHRGPSNNAVHVAHLIVDLRQEAERQTAAAARKRD
ncbi:hypothetical protein [Sorangium sp. So ce1151]|uniref:hypothetical protein n=1 Tax=Sorangium sp. So ce1151 TaxID=3133332 RepID=UPI003F62DF6A